MIMGVSNVSVKQIDPMMPYNIPFYSQMKKMGTILVILRRIQTLEGLFLAWIFIVITPRLAIATLKELRVDSYIHLRDGIQNDATGRNLGQIRIPPSSFTGSPRYMHGKTQDAMTYVRNYGRPNVFITFTCNARWSEIQNELLPGQTYFRRHDLIARVFRLKLVRLMDVITKFHVFGPVRCHMYTIEW